MAQTHDHTTQSICPACNFGPFTRNNYFTGKLLVERDFTDEARFHMEKLRHHEQRLHGWGVVCGLKVKPHPNPACQDRFIYIEPGSAVDCCGYDIIVREEECVDITQLESIKALKKKEDANPEGREPHTLQVCLRYRECPTEEIPVLYDECGCDDTQCAPNRILESYEIDVIVDPPIPPDLPHVPVLAWNHHGTLLAKVARIAVYDRSQPERLYMLVENDVYQVDPNTPIVGPNFDLDATGLEIAVSTKGDHLFVVTEPPATSSTHFRQLVVLRTSNMTHVRTIDIADSIDSDIRLAATSDDRLIALVGTPGKVLIWTTAELTGPTEPSLRMPVELLQPLQSLAIATDATRAYAVGPNDKLIRVVDTAGPGSSATDIDVLPDGTKPTTVEVVRSGGSDRLVVLDQSARKLYLVGLNPDKLLGPPANPGVSLEDYEPVAIATSPGGQWAYVLERDPTAPEKNFVQIVDLHRLGLQQEVTASPPFEVGNASQQIFVSASGTILYVPYLGLPSDAFDGGVAKIAIKAVDCDELLWAHLDGCPHCDSPNCIVLATITDYHIGGPINDGNINNRTRRLLPSTQVLTELIECLREHGMGGGRTQGPAGEPGQNGEPGRQGDRGPEGPGLEEGLTRIAALSWSHNQLHNHGDPSNPNDPNSESFFVMVKRQNESETPGIVIGFTDEVQVSELIDAEHVFQVMVEHTSDANFVCRCPIRGKTIPVNLRLDGQGRIVLNNGGRIDFAEEVPPGTAARGVAFLLNFTDDSEPVVPIARSIVGGAFSELWVILRGDFVKDTQDRAIDAEFVRAELPSGDRPENSNVGIQGGLFESWFQIRLG